MSTLCRHCAKAKVNRPRGLCWVCWHKPAIRDLYPSTSKYARRGVGNLTGTRPLPVPTTAVPGTAEKREVLWARALAGEALFHPRDAKYHGDPRPLEYLKRAA